MQKVTSINLNGNAYQLEDGAYKALQDYLDTARAQLADDPDRSEIMHDFEQAIAEKCDHVLSEHKNVVSAAEMEHIITAMGPVEATNHDDAGASAPHNAGPAKRLYTLKDGAILGGVCNGVAAYLHVDVTIVRLMFIILSFATSGFMVLVYFLMMIVVPEAQTPEQKAELRGERFTASDVLDRAKKKYAEVSSQGHWKKVAHDNAPALSSAGQLVLKIVRVIAAIIIAFAAFISVLVTAVWVSTMWAVLSGNVQMHDQLSTISTWAVASGITSAYLLAMVPALLLVLVLRRLFTSPTAEQARSNTRIVISGVVLWMIALVVMLCVGIINAGRIRDYQQSHGYLYLNKSQTERMCINSEICAYGVNNHTPILERY